MEEIILSLEKSAMERWRQGDPWGWAEISAEDVIYMDPGLTGPIVGLEEYKTYLKPDGSIASRSPWNSSYVCVRIDAEWRIIHNHWSFIKGERYE